MSNAGETLDLAGVAALFGAEPETVAQYARTGELPGTRIGKRWIFLREDALSFLRQRIAQAHKPDRPQRKSLMALCSSTVHADGARDFRHYPS